jgi:hypothetical protein
VTAHKPPSPFYRSPAPCLLGTRAQAATHTRTCAHCGTRTAAGERIAYVDELGWCHMRCVVQLPGQTR